MSGPQCSGPLQLDVQAPPGQLFLHQLMYPLSPIGGHSLSSVHGSPSGKSMNQPPVPAFPPTPFASPPEPVLPPLEPPDADELSAPLPPDWVPPVASISAFPPPQAASTTRRSTEGGANLKGPIDICTLPSLLTCRHRLETVRASPARRVHITSSHALLSKLQHHSASSTLARRAVRQER